MGQFPSVIESIRPGATAARAQVAIFDFDGTLSLIRSGWMAVMVPMCVEYLQETDTAESTDALIEVVEEFVGRLTGKETIYQMMALSEAIRARGGAPHEPLFYKREYLRRLHGRIQHRLQALAEGGGSPEQYTVPGSRALLQWLVERGLMLYLASGTDDANVKQEAGLLGLNGFFEGRIFGAQDNLQSFSKALLVQELVTRDGYSGAQLIVFGDGFVEIEEVSKVGGTAVGVATDEPDCQAVDAWKRERLIRAGADFILPHFGNLTAIQQKIFSEH